MQCEEMVTLSIAIGNPILEDGVTRRAITVMVANDGVMDLILNLFCSLKSAGINLDGFVVFVGQPDHVDLVNSMGAHGVYSEVSQVLWYCGTLDCLLGTVL